MSKYFWFIIGLLFAIAALLYACIDTSSTEERADRELQRIRRLGDQAAAKIKAEFADNEKWLKENEAAYRARKAEIPKRIEEIKVIQARIAATKKYLKENQHSPDSSDSR